MRALHLGSVLASVDLFIDDRGDGMVAQSINRISKAMPAISYAVFECPNGDDPEPESKSCKFLDGIPLVMKAKISERRELKSPSWIGAVEMSWWIGNRESPMRQIDEDIYLSLC